MDLGQVQAQFFLNTQEGLPLALPFPEDVSGCSIAPALSAGLVFDADTCQVDGQPSQDLVPTAYQVSATGDKQNYAMTLNLQVDTHRFAQDFEELFSLDTLKTIRIQISEAEWNALLTDFEANNRNENYRLADFYYGDSLATAERVANVAFRLRGNSFSRKRPEEGSGPHRSTNRLVRTHFKIKFNERFNEDESVYGSGASDLPEVEANRGRTFRGVRSLNLKWNNNDPSYLREVYIFDLLRQNGVATARWAFTRFYIQIGNEPERYMGVYAMGENMDSTWLRRHFASNTYLYKCLYQREGPADLSRGDRDNNDARGRIGSEITDPTTPTNNFKAYRPTYDLKTQEDEFLTAQNKLNELIDLLATSNPTRAQIEQMIDTEALLKTQAVMAFVGKWDGYWRNGNNYYLALDPNTDKWVFISYDNDLALSDNAFNLDIARNLSRQPFLSWGATTEVNPVLMEKVLAITELRQQYTGYVARLVDSRFGILHPATARTQLQALQDLIANDLDELDAVDSTPYRNQFNSIMQYITARATHASNPE